MSTYIGELIKQHFGVSRRNQSWSLAAVEVMAKAVLGGFAMIVSDDDSGPINPNADNQIAPSASMVELQPSTPAAADPNDPTLWTLLAARDTDDLARTRHNSKVRAQSRSRTTMTRPGSCPISWPARSG